MHCCLTNCVSDMMPVMSPDMPPVISILATDFFLNTLTVVCAPTESCVEYFAICSFMQLERKRWNEMFDILCSSVLYRQGSLLLLFLHYNMAWSKSFFKSKLTAFIFMTSTQLGPAWGGLWWLATVRLIFVECLCLLMQQKLPFPQSSWLVMITSTIEKVTASSPNY